MRIEELQNYIKSESSSLYSFAFVLVPDDLQATQLMIDAVQSFLIQKSVWIEKVQEQKNKATKNQLIEINLNIFKIMFELSKKRYQHLKMSFKDVENNGGFYSLEIDEKASLYLKEKYHLNLEEIEFITSKTKAEIVTYLTFARHKILEIKATESDNIQGSMNA